MAMGKRNTENHPELWIDYTQIPRSPGHPFYESLNRILSKHNFDAFVENLCSKFYSEKMYESVGNPESLSADPVSEVVADKGYHSDAVLVELSDAEIRSYVSDPDRGRRNWVGKPDAQKAVYSNRRRIKGNRGKRLMKKRGKLVERSFAHCYGTGGLRRIFLRGRENILKRLLLHVGGFNLGLIMRKLFGKGTPRGIQGLISALNSQCERIFSGIRLLILIFQPFPSKKSIYPKKSGVASSGSLNNGVFVN